MLRHLNQAGGWGAFDSASSSRRAAATSNVVLAAAVLVRIDPTSPRTEDLNSKQP